jgi:hypothetical protein
MKGLITLFMGQFEKTSYKEEGLHYQPFAEQSVITSYK